MDLVLRAYSLLFIFFLASCVTNSDPSKEVRVINIESVKEKPESNSIDINNIAKQPDISSIEDGSISTMTLIESDIWIGKLGGALIRHNLYTGDSTVFLEDNYSILDFSIKKILDSSKTIYVLQTNRIISIDKSTDTLKIISLPENVSRASDIVIHKDEFYISTLGHGLFKFNNSTTQFKKVPLKIDFISSLHVTENTLYLGSMGNGLYSYDLHNSRLNSRLHYPHQLFNKNITKITSRDSKLFIGTVDQGLIKWNLESNKIDRLYSNKTVSSIFNSENFTAVSFIGYGLYIESIKDSLFESIKGSLKTNNITTIAIFNDKLITGNIKKGVIKQEMEFLQ